jgi:hypothetical protein
MYYQTAFTRISKLALLPALMAGAVLTHSAAASELKPDRAYSVNHGSQTIVIFYTETADGTYQLVTTIGSSDGNVPSVQYNSMLLPGQQQRINFANTDRSVLEIARSENAVDMQISD